MKAKPGCLLAALIVSSSSAGSIHATSTIQFNAAADTVPEWADTLGLTVERLGDTNSSVTVDYATADGTARADVKYTPTGGTLVFAAGETTKTLVVPIINEGFVESTKSFKVLLSNPTGGAMLAAPTNAIVSILDIDVGIQFQFASYSSGSHKPLAEDAGAVLIGVVRGDDADFPVSVDMVTSDLTAMSGVDYTGVTNTLTFGPQERLKFVPVAIANDTLKEAPKSFRVTLANPVGVTLGSTKTTTVTILDNDQGFAFESPNYYVAEDGGVALIGVLRGTDETNSGVTVDFATANGTAFSSLDYTGATNTLTFAPGESFKMVAVPILNDGVQEPNKSFRVSLSHPAGGAALGAPTTTTVTIRDNDPGVGFERTRYTNAWDQVDDFTVTILRGNDGALGPITVDYVTSDLTAEAGEDYQPLSGTLAFGENETVKSLAIPLLRSRSTAGAKTFQVTLSNPTGGATLGASITTATIVGVYAAIAPSFDTALTIRHEAGVNILTWAGGGHLQRADRATGPWQTLLTATNPHTVLPPVPTAFYRVTRPRPTNLYVPSGYDGQTKLPLIILLHGYGADAPEFCRSKHDPRWYPTQQVGSAGVRAGRGRGTCPAEYLVLSTCCLASLPRKVVRRGICLRQFTLTEDG